MSVKKTLLSGFFYTGLAKYSGIVVSLIISAILSRLLLPKDFGVIAIASVFINFFSTLTTVGIGPAIVQNKTLEEDDLKSINAFTIYLGIGLTLLFAVLIPLICSFYDDTENLLSTLAILSISIFFSVAAIVPNAVIMKNKEFKFIAKRTFFIQLSMGVVSVIAALNGLGIYSLLINPVIGSLVLLIVNFRKVPIGFSLVPQKESIKKILSFSVYQMLFNLVYLLYRNIDKIVIGKKFGATQLGYYEKSYRLMLMPLENISGVISPVLHPVLSEYQTDKEFLWNNYLRVVKLLGEIGFYLTVLAYFCADTIITILFGSQWGPSIPLFKILSLSICFQIMQAPIGAFLQALNNVKSLFYSSLIVLLLVVLSIGVGLLFNDMIVFCYALTFSFSVTFLVYQFFFSKIYHRSILPIIKVIIKPFLSNFLLFAGFFVAFDICGAQHTLLSTIIVVIISIVYEFVVLKIGFAEELKNLLFKTKIK